MTYQHEPCINAKIAFKDLPIGQIFKTHIADINKLIKISDTEAKFDDNDYIYKPHQDLEVIIKVHKAFVIFKEEIDPIKEEILSKVIWDAPVLFKKQLIQYSDNINEHFALDLSKSTVEESWVWQFKNGKWSEKSIPYLGIKNIKSWLIMKS
ncbi:MAG: hypothetical protein ACD_33C00045G0035 [uncultured bacterium]|nr:MAG: hypothetical protein ACD_33C00045G0035 [uncultured bacterium]